MIFKQNSYIVIELITAARSESFLVNYIYKQREDYDYLRSCLDSQGRDDNGWSHIHVDAPERWRYATEDEAAMYEALGKPFNVLIPPTDLHPYLLDELDRKIEAMERRLS